MGSPGCSAATAASPRRATSPAAVARPLPRIAAAALRRPVRCRADDVKLPRLAALLAATCAVGCSTITPAVDRVPSAAIAHTAVDVAPTAGDQIIPEEQSGDVVVLVFTSTECPIAKAMAPELRRIYRDLGDECRISLVYVQRDLDVAEAAVHGRQFGLGEIPALVDSDHSLVEKYDVSTTPEVVVFRSGVSGVLYQGRINDLYPSLGNRRDTPSQHDLRDAIAAALVGERVSPAYRLPIGCRIERVQ